MISRSGNGNFLVRHYDWIAAGVGVVALLGAVAYFAATLDTDAERAAADEVGRLVFRNGPSTGVEKVDMAPYTTAAQAVRSPQRLSEVSNRQESFLASERRVKCTCGKITVSGQQACPACKKSFVVVNKVDEEKKKREQWELRNGVVFDDTDKDNDGFTNREEYFANTNPNDPESHPDYLDSLYLLSLKQRFVPFYLRAVRMIPAGYRCEFVYSETKTPFTALVGEEMEVAQKNTSGIGAAAKMPTGFKLLAAEKKESEVHFKQSSGIVGKKSVDASTAKIRRLADGRELELVVQNGKPNYTPIDKLATLHYRRGAGQTFEKSIGDTIDLNGTKYKILDIKDKDADRGAVVILQNEISGKKRIIRESADVNENT